MQSPPSGSPPTRPVVDFTYNTERAQLLASLYAAEYDYGAEADAIVGLVGEAIHAYPVVEVGSGPGLLAIELARRGVSICATDRSQEMIALAREAAHRERVAISFVVSDSLEGVSGEYGAIVSQRMAPSLQELQRILERARGLLVPGGRALLACWDPDSLPEWLKGGQTITVDRATHNGRELVRLSDWTNCGDFHRWRFLDLISESQSFAVRSEAHTIRLPHVPFADAEGLARSLGYRNIRRAPSITGATVDAQRGPM